MTMPSLVLVMDAEKDWSDLRGSDLSKVIHHKDAIGIGVMPQGMSSGKPSVFIRLDLTDGSIVLAETSAALFVAAAQAISAKYPDLLK